MARKKKAEKAKQSDKALKAQHELFCRYYTSSGDTFGNATLSYAEAFDYKLDELSHDKPAYEETDLDTGEKSEYDQQYHIASVNGARLLRKASVQQRIVVLLNELLKDEIVDSELAKVIMQDGELPSKVAAVREYNKIRGRIIDKTMQINRLPFGETDLSTVIAALPQERQDHFYALIGEIIKEAELLRSTGAAQGGGTR